MIYLQCLLGCNHDLYKQIHQSWFSYPPTMTHKTQLTWCINNTRFPSYLSLFSCFSSTSKLTLRCRLTKYFLHWYQKVSAHMFFDSHARYKASWLKIHFIIKARVGSRVKNQISFVFQSRIFHLRWNHYFL